MNTCGRACRKSFSRPCKRTRRQHENRRSLCLICQDCTVTGLTIRTAFVAELTEVLRFRTLLQYVPTFDPRCAGLLKVFKNSTNLISRASSPTSESKLGLNTAFTVSLLLTCEDKQSYSRPQHKILVVRYERRYNCHSCMQLGGLNRSVWWVAYCEEVGSLKEPCLQSNLMGVSRFSKDYSNHRK